MKSSERSLIVAPGMPRNKENDRKSLGRTNQFHKAGLL